MPSDWLLGGSHRFSGSIRLELVTGLDWKTQTTGGGSILDADNPIKRAVLHADQQL